MSLSDKAEESEIYVLGVERCHILRQKSLTQKEKWALMRNNMLFCVVA